jgi:hypothetical protein
VGIDGTSTPAPRMPLPPRKLSVCVCNVGLRRDGWIRRVVGRGGAGRGKDVARPDAA